MSDVSSLRARLAEEEARNRELRSLMYELSSGVSNAYREMSGYEQQINQTLIKQVGRKGQELDVD
jgi:hypothetical protein